MEKLNLYVINEVLSDYTSGMVVIAAESLEKAGSLFANEWPDARLIEEFDAAIANGAYKTLQVVGQSEGVVDYVYGGG